MAIEVLDGEDLPGGTGGTGWTGTDGPGKGGTGGGIDPEGVAKAAAVTLGVGAVLGVVLETAPYWAPLLLL